MDKNTIAFIPVFLLAVLHLHDGIKMLCLKGRHAKKIKAILAKEKFLIFCKKMGLAEIVFSLTLFAGAIQVCYFRSGGNIILLWFVPMVIEIAYMFYCTYKYTGNAFTKW